jgi:hypothetical protein
VLLSPTLSELGFDNGAALRDLIADAPIVLQGNELSLTLPPHSATWVADPAR